jgi:hypothetical protein
MICKNVTTRRSRRYLVTCVCALVLGGSCVPAPEPGKLGGVCVDVDMCDFGLVCEKGRCERGVYDTSDPPDALSPVLDATVDPAGAGGLPAGAGGSTSRGGTPGNGGRPNGGGGSSSGGSAGEGGGTSTGGEGGTGTTSPTCVGIPSAQGQCNRNACLCAVTAECFPRNSATACCSEPPICG